MIEKHHQIWCKVNKRCIYISDILANLVKAQTLQIPRYSHLLSRLSASYCARCQQKKNSEQKQTWDLPSRGLTSREKQTPNCNCANLQGEGEVTSAYTRGYLMYSGGSRKASLGKWLKLDLRNEQQLQQRTERRTFHAEETLCARLEPALLRVRHRERQEREGFGNLASRLDEW